MNALDALKAFAFVGHLSEPAKASLRQLGIVRMVAPRAPLLTRGDAAGGALFIVSGGVRVFYIDQKGRQGTLYRVAPGEACFLSLECALRGTPYPAWAESEGLPTQLVRIPTDLYLSFFAEEPAFQRFTYDSLSARLLQLMAVLEGSATLALEQRTAALLLELADAQGKVASSQAQLADHLGSAREVITRTLSEFRSRGFIETRRGAVQILSRAGLEKLSGRGRFE